MASSKAVASISVMGLRILRAVRSAVAELDTSRVGGPQPITTAANAAAHSPFRRIRSESMPFISVALSLHDRTATRRREASCITSFLDSWKAELVNRSSAHQRCTQIQRLIRPEFSCQCRDETSKYLTTPVRRTYVHENKNINGRQMQISLDYPIQ